MRSKPDPTNGGISNHILPTSATMAGVCITVISIVRLIEANRHVSTVIDNIMAFAGLLFLVSCFLSYIALRSARRTVEFEKYADFLFLAGLSLMVVGGFLLPGSSSTFEIGWVKRYGG